MKWSVIFLIAALTTGCAFKKSEAEQSDGTGASQGGVQAPSSGESVSFRIAGVTQDKTKPAPDITASEALSRDASTHVLRSDNPLVIPAVVPEAMVIRLVTTAVNGVQGGFKGEIRAGERVVREIPMAAFAATDGVEFSLTDLKSLFPADTQAQVSVAVSVLDAKGRVADTITFGISTPPSKVSVRPFLPYGSYEKQKQISIPDTFKKVAVPGGSFIELVGVLELSNSEKDPINVDVPSKLAHSLSRIETQTQVNIGDCSYSLSTTSNESHVDSELRLLPIGPDIFRAVEETQSADLVRIRVGPEDVAQVGIYAVSGLSFALPDDRMTSQSVPVRCWATCQRGAEGDWNDQGKWGGDCFSCGGIPGNTGQSCYSCMSQHRDWCAWQDWRAWKDYTTVAGGFEYSLNFAPVSDDKGPGTFFVSFLNQRVGGRSGRVFNESIRFKK